MGNALLRIESPDGAQYCVSEDVYNETYKDQEYTVVSYEDGTPYGGDAEPTVWATNPSLLAPAIGTEATNVTNVDGEEVSADEATAAGVEMAAQAAPVAEARGARAAATAVTAAPVEGGQ